MPRFDLRFQDIHYQLNPTDREIVLRPTLDVRIATSSKPSSAYCIVDTGAPFSVISYHVAHAMGRHLTPVHVDDPILRHEAGVASVPVAAQALLEWRGIPCELVRLDVELHGATGSSGPLLLLAKRVTAPQPTFFNDEFVLLGMHFFAANGIGLRMAAQQWGAQGSIDVP